VGEEQLTIGPAARYLGKSVETLRRWELEGRLLPAERNSRGQRLYTRDQLDQVLASARVKPSDGRTPSTARDSSSSRLDGPLGPTLRPLWHQARLHILRVTTTPVRDREDSPWFDADHPWRYIWYPEATDRCAEQCERRVLRYLFPGVSVDDLKHIINRTVATFIEDDIDRRLRAEILAQGGNPDEY
jgi:MerR-like DNA binding protein